MSDDAHDPAALAKAVRERQVIETTVTMPDGEEYTVVYEDGTVNDLEAIYEDAVDGQDTVMQSDILAAFVDEKLVEPELDGTDLNEAWGNALLEQYMAELGYAPEKIQAAMEELEGGLDGGNE